MGMYTELVCACELKSETPDDVIKIIGFMTGQLEQDEDDLLIPKASLFEEGSRWRFMLRSDSYYFDGTTHSDLKYDYLIPSKPSYYLTIRCNLKNYQDEIENFINWIEPYIVKDKEIMFIGYKRYEEDNEPTLLYV